MSDWISQYSAALQARDRREAAHRSYVQIYTKLADRTAILENAITTQTHGTEASPGSRSSAQNPRASDAQLSRLQTDLSTAQRERNDLTTRLSRLETQLADVTSRATKADKRAAALERDKKDTDRKLKDQIEEIRGKNRLVIEAHDEMVGLNLQLNMAEERAGKLKTENEELVRRWMERMGQEAEKMNNDSQWT